MTIAFKAPRYYTLKPDGSFDKPYAAYIIAEVRDVFGATPAGLPQEVTLVLRAHSGRVDRDLSAEGPLLLKLSENDHPFHVLAQIRNALANGGYRYRYLRFDGIDSPEVSVPVSSHGQISYKPLLEEWHGETLQQGARIIRELIEKNDS